MTNAVSPFLGLADFVLAATPLVAVLLAVVEFMVR
jgi:hypothetical protein